MRKYTLAGLLVFTLSLLVSATAVVAIALDRGNGAEPDSLHPHKAQGLNSHHILHDIYEGLLTYDKQGQPVLGVAERYTVSEDGLQWDFRLKKNARWSDGSEVVAGDFIRAWQQAIKPTTAAPYGFLFANMRNQQQLQVSSRDKHQLQIKLQSPDLRLPDKLVLPVFAPLPAAGKSVFNGAYQLQRHQPHEYVELQKNTFFHAADSVHFETIRYLVTENQNSELLRFRAGELAITETVPDAQLDWLRVHLADALRIAPYNGSFFLGVNLTDKQLTDLNLRKALNFAINRTILVEKVLKSGQQPAAGLLPDESNKKDLFDLEKAQQYLALSGFNIKRDRLEILYNNSDNQKKVALAVAAMWWQNLGIKSRLKNQEWKVFIETRKGPNKQLFRGGWIADYEDSLNYLQLFESQSHFNYYGFNDPRYDALLKRLRTQVLTVHERATLSSQADAILQQQLPMIPLYFYVSRHLVNPGLKGYINNFSDKHLSRYLYQ